MSEQIDRLNAALVGRYDVEREIGSGGMATVYLARDIKHNRPVAVKVLSSELAAVVGRDRFLAEINVTANLQHPHLLPLFDSGDADGLLFYVMPYIEGESLRTRLDRERQLTIDDALHIASAVGSALDYAHRHGVIHRDLKPENILLHERDPLLMDFGIALAVSNAGGARVTQAGISLGTPQYMSPEQATGDRQIDARSDIYSLGAVTYEMLAGEPPHAGTDVRAVMARVIRDRPRDLRSLRDTVPEHVDEAVLRALAKLPADRFTSAADFVSALGSSRSLAIGASVRQSALSGVVRELPFAPERRPLVTKRTVGFGTVGMAAAAIAGAFGAVALNRPVAEPQARFVVELPDSVEFSITQYRQVALARDGSRAVFNFSNNFPGPLFTRRTGELQFDIIPGSDSARSMVISPKGGHVLYWLGFGPTARLMKIAIEGGAPVKIADSASAHTQASWGDGDQVIFRRGESLFLVSANGGPDRLVAKPDSTKHQGALGWPEMLPGGKAALITILHGADQGADSLYIGAVSLADGKVVDFGIRGLTPHFASGHVLYVRQDGQLFARPFDVGKLAFTGEPIVIAKDLSGRPGGGNGFSYGVTDLAVSQTGTILFTDGGPFLLSSGGGLRRSIVMRSNDKNQFTWLKVPQLAYQDLRASPDGQRLALTIQDSTNARRRDVYYLTFATGQLRLFTHDGMSSQPTWSPDGKRIIYKVTNPGAKPVQRFYSRPWDESEAATALPGADGAEAVEFPGPSGKYIAYVRGDSGVEQNRYTNSDIYIAPIDSPGVARPFAASGLRERMPRFSPDGKWLAYIGHELPPTANGPVPLALLYVRPVPGPGAVTQVSIKEGNSPMWSRDGRTLFYFAGGGGSPLVAATVSETKGVFEVKSTTEVPANAQPRIGFGFPLAPTQVDILPSGDIAILSTFADPQGAAAGPARARAPVVNTSKLIAIVNWLAGAERTAVPR